MGGEDTEKLETFEPLVLKVFYLIFIRNNGDSIVKRMSHSIWSWRAVEKPMLQPLL